MAKSEKKKIEAMEGSRFGTYQEGVGGGASPEPGDPSKHGHGVNSDHRKANNDTMQPRTDDGKFTYKSVNGQSIDPKYGPSRGKTVNPLLTGGENGIMIADVEQEFYNESGALWDKYKDKWYQKGSEYSLMSQGKNHKADWSTRVAGDAIWRVAQRRYDKVKGEFQGESKVFAEGKKGKRTAEEEAAHQLSQQTGQEQAVISQKTGGIALKPGTVKNFPAQPKPTAPTQGQFPAPSVGGKQPSAPSTQLTHSKAQLDTARQVLEDAGVDTSGYTDEQLDQVVDDYIDFSEIDTSESVAPVENKQEIKEEPKEEDSEAVKTVKKLGFSDEEEEEK